MPVVEDPGRPRGRLLVDAAGATIAAFELDERHGMPVADLLEPAGGVETDRAVAAIMAELHGWRVGAGVELGRCLVAAGAEPRRHVHVMSRDLARNPALGDWLEPPLPTGVRLTPVDRPAIDLAPAFAAAFPPGHPDNADMSEHPDRELDDLVSGRLLGPLLRCSLLAVGEGGEVVGAILVNGQPGEPPLGGPWISNIFRRPDAPGVGGALLKRSLALATRDRLPAVSLAVTHANPARAWYETYGFADVLAIFNVQVP